jgi:DNA-directed RNA polymerase subunit RPC12/RpoP
MESKYEGLQFYRCVLCQGVVSPWDIREIHECPKCAGRRMMPTNLTLIEKVIQVWKHPNIRGWKNVKI